MTTTYDEKYVVFKREDWDELLTAITYGHTLKLPEPLQGAHVIREQDVFATGVFYAYASAVTAAIEVLEAAGAKVPGHLYEVREHFFSAALTSQDAHRKIPT